MKKILIIPYRNRKNHLDYFLKNSWPKLKEKVKDMEIIIVEQKEGREFNRGATINVGYLYYTGDEKVVQDLNKVRNQVIDNSKEALEVLDKASEEFSKSKK